MPQPSGVLNQQLYHRLFQTGRGRGEIISVICFDFSALYLFDHVTGSTFDPPFLVFLVLLLLDISLLGHFSPKI